MRNRIILGVLSLGVFLLIGGALWIFFQPTIPPSAVATEACDLSCASPVPFEVLSYDGKYTVSYSSDVGGLPLNQIHTWTLHVQTTDGKNVEDALIKVDGGMPAHNHGLPTSPAVTMYLGDGNYRVEGIKFHMRGEWVMDFEITAGGESDLARFDLVVK